MAREISKTAAVRTVQEVSFNRRAVSGIKITGDELKADVELSSTEHETTDSEPVVVDLSGITVQTVLDELETYLGSAPNLSETSFLDLVNSVVHERADA